MTGTRFNLFVQPPFGRLDAEPETITVSSPIGSVGPGPSDTRMYVVDPFDKLFPYGQNTQSDGRSFVYLPPWDGAANAPAEPSADGHFDHLHPGDAGFEAAHLFGSVRFTLDVWERYLGGAFPWHFNAHFDRLEISILPHWDNAQFGYGFLEAGSQFEPDGQVLPFSLSFDVIAHELGHAIVYSQVGLPPRGTELPEYLGFQESAADLVSLIAAMHFPSVIDEVLEGTSGNLYHHNRLARFSEFSNTKQMRSAANNMTMAHFARGWETEHELSQPLTGAIFDLLVDIYHESLKAEGLISNEHEELSDRAQDDPELEPLLQEAFDEAYSADREGFHRNLLDARDIVGFFLGDMFHRLGPSFLDYVDIGRTLVDIDQQENGGMFTGLILHNFQRRQIGDIDAGPRLKQPGRLSHSNSDRTYVPV